MRLAVSCFYLCRLIGSCVDLEPRGLNLAGRHLAGRRIRGVAHGSKYQPDSAGARRILEMFETFRNFSG
jgi:hypothetical protein